MRTVNALSTAADAVALETAWNTIEPELEKFQLADRAFFRRFYTQHLQKLQQQPR